MSEPIYNFGKLKKTLTELGFEVGEAQPYVPLAIEDVSLLSGASSNIEMASDGIFYINPHTGSRHQVFLYKRNVDLARFGIPKFHIRYCRTLQDYGRDAYRRANTGKVIVFDRSQQKDVEISGLPLCKNCLSIVLQEHLEGYNSSMTSEEFEQILREANKDAENEDDNTDLDGYIWKWKKISDKYRSLKNYTCELCGFKPQNKFDRQYLHVHHKDGNKLNNKTDNLMCLCIACHSQINERHRENFSKGANRISLDAFKKKYPDAGADRSLISIFNPDSSDDFEFLKKQFSQVEKHPFFKYIAITNSLIGEAVDSDRIKNIWLDHPDSYRFSFVDKEGFICGRYSIDGGKTKYEIKIPGDTGSIDDTVRFTELLFNKMGLMNRFKEIGYECIDYLNASENLKYH